MTSNNKVVILDKGFNPYTASNPLNVMFPDSARNDAFQRIRTSEPETIFDSKQIFDNQPLIFDDQEVSGTGTSSVWSKDRASSVMSVSSSTAGKRVRQTFMRFNYQPGKSQFILLTGRIGDSGQAGITRAIGYFDDSNGVFVRDNEGTIEVVIRSGVTGSTVEDAVAQSSWNIDKLDGTGSSGYTLDPTKAQIFVIDFEWLGVGRVRTGFVIDGKIVYCHEFNHSNIIDSVYMSTPNLPIRYEIENDGTGGAATLEHICSTVMSEGGTQNTGVLRHYNGPRLTNLSSDTKYVFMAGRLKSTHFGATINIENVSIIATGNTDNAKWELIAGGTLSAGTLSFSDFTNSSVQIADGDKTQIHNNDGVVIDGGYFTSELPSNIGIPNALKLGSTIDGTPQVFYFVVTPITNNITIEPSITWRELS